MDHQSLAAPAVCPNATPLEQFDQVLVASGDLARLRPEAVSLLLAIRHRLRTQASDDEAGEFPDLDALQGLTGLDAAQVDTGLDSLYRCGYLDRERGRDGAQPAGYRLREKAIWRDEDGEIAGEISWDLPASPSGLIGLPEFRNILLSDRLNGAKVVHIERLQVNVNGPREGGISVNTQAPGGAEATQLQLIQLLEQMRSQWSAPPMAIAAQAPAQPAAPQAPVQPEPAAPVQAQPAPAPVPQAAPTSPTTAAAQPADEVADLAEFEKLYHHYVDRVHGEFVAALKAAEDAADQAYRTLVQQQVRKPKRPMGLAALLAGQRWQQAHEQWLQEQTRLQTAYDLSVKERQRLVEAMMPAPNGEQPLYVREALDQLRQDHAGLWARTEAVRQNWF